MKSYLIKDTTVHERIEMLKEWTEVEGCEDSGMDPLDFYADYINGIREISEINASYSARYVSEIPDDDKRVSCEMGTRR